MTKQELKELIIECITELQSEGVGSINIHHRIKLKNLEKDGWSVDGWYNKQKGEIKVIRTNPKTSKMEIGVVNRDGNFEIKKSI